MAAVWEPACTQHPSPDVIVGTTRTVKFVSQSVYVKVDFAMNSLYTHFNGNIITKICDNHLFEELPALRKSHMFS